MLISATPIFSNIIDGVTILRVVMQLEIETTAKNTNTMNEDLHEGGKKLFNSTDQDHAHFAHLAIEESKKNRYLKNDKDIYSFHLEVPHPPPNC